MNGNHRQSRSPERRSPRLAGYDYGEPGEYFVTVCTHGRRCIFGDIVDGKLALSPAGKIVDACWREIPDHFPHVRTQAFQVMPNHVHGIIEIGWRIKPNKHRVGVEYIQPLHGSGIGERPAGGFQHIPAGSLPSIIRSFKAAVTREARKRGMVQQNIWQRSFHDHIIRDDTEHFFIERYITLNPLLWHFDRNNPDAPHTSADELRQKHRLKQQTPTRAIPTNLTKIVPYFADSYLAVRDT